MANLFYQEKRAAKGASASSIKQSWGIVTIISVIALGVGLALSPSHLTRTPITPLPGVLSSVARRRMCAATVRVLTDDHRLLPIGGTARGRFLMVGQRRGTDGMFCPSAVAIHPR